MVSGESTFITQAVAQSLMAILLWRQMLLVSHCTLQLGESNMF